MINIDLDTFSFTIISIKETFCYRLIDMVFNANFSNIRVISWREQILLLI